MKGREHENVYYCLQLQWRETNYITWHRHRYTPALKKDFQFSMGNISLSCIGGGHGNPLQCSCLENPRDCGAWWAAVPLTRLGWVLFSSWAKSSPLRAIEKGHCRRAACQGGRAPGERLGWGAGCCHLGSGAGTLQRCVARSIWEEWCNEEALWVAVKGRRGWTCRQSCHVGAPGPFGPFQ